MLDNRVLLPNDYEDHRRYLVVADIDIKELFDKTIEFLRLLTEGRKTNE